MTQEEIIEMAIQGHASTRDAIRWAMNQEREQSEPVAWNLKDVTDAYKLGAKSQQRTWVGLKDEEIISLMKQFPDHLTRDVAQAIEAKLKEKNT